MRPDRLVSWLFIAVQLRARGLVSRGRERGDVPGWVMVTVMTAGMVVAIFAVFKDAITEAVQNALSQVVSETDGH